MDNFKFLDQKKDKISSMDYLTIFPNKYLFNFSLCHAFLFCPSILKPNFDLKVKNGYRGKERYELLVPVFLLNQGPLRILPVLQWIDIVFR